MLLTEVLKYLTTEYSRLFRGSNHSSVFHSFSLRQHYSCDWGNREAERTFWRLF